MYKAKAIAATGVNVVELVDIELPELKPGELLIRTEFTAVSPGTDLRCLAGLQRGNMPFPFILGYSLVGIVESACGDSHVPVGTRVFAAGTSRASINLQFGGHVSRAIVRADRVVPIPDGCPPQQAALAKLVAIALRGCRIAEPKPSDNVAVVGLGPIGLLSLRQFHAAGANVLGVDQDASRVDRAKKDGVAASLVTGTIQQAVFSHFGQGADIVVDATGVPAVLPLSIRAARELPWDQSHLVGPKVVIQGSYPDPFTLSYNDCFLKELQILTPRDHTPANLVEAVGMVADGTIKVDDLISWSGHVGSAPDVYARLRADRTIMTAVFDWRG
jgi:2-desacetyl-2-hydroxyethyl bacteriochlorophyllide A dehydrogenase